MAPLRARIFVQLCVTSDGSRRGSLPDPSPYVPERNEYLLKCREVRSTSVSAGIPGVSGGPPASAAIKVTKAERLPI